MAYCFITITTVQIGMFFSAEQNILFKFYNKT